MDSLSQNPIDRVRARLQRQAQQLALQRSEAGEEQAAAVGQFAAAPRLRKGRAVLLTLIGLLLLGSTGFLVQQYLHYNPELLLNLRGTPAALADPAARPGHGPAQLAAEPTPLTQVAQ